MNVWIVIVMVMLAEFGLHYFPWRLALRGRDLPKVVAYTLGTLAIMGPLTAWLWARGEMEVIQTLWMVTFAAGLMVMALYGLDHYLQLEMRAMEQGERERMYREQHGKKS